MCGGNAAYYQNTLTTCCKLVRMVISGRKPYVPKTMTLFEFFGGMSEIVLGISQVQAAESARDKTPAAQKHAVTVY